MSASFTWDFPQSDVIKSQDGLTNVVSVVHWILTAIDGGFSARAAGVVALDKVSNPSDFTPFDQLTKDQVEGWVISSLNKQNKRPHNPKDQNPPPEIPFVDALKASLERQIEDKKNPPIVPMPFDFGG